MVTKASTRVLPMIVYAGTSTKSSKNSGALKARKIASNALCVGVGTGVFVGLGVAVGGIEVAVGGTAVAVGAGAAVGAGRAVGAGTAVAVDAGAAVGAAGTAVEIGATGAGVGWAETVGTVVGTAVGAVVGTAVADSSSPPPLHASASALSATTAGRGRRFQFDI